MNKTIGFVIVFILLSTLVYAREVPNTNRGIANAVPGDHIIRSNGQRVVLNHGDINHARRQLGLTISSNRQQAQSVKAGTNSIDSRALLFLAIIFGLVLLPFLPSFSSSGSYKSSSSYERKRIQISKQYRDIVSEVEFAGSASHAFRWSKLWISRWFGKTARILSDSNLGFISATYSYFSHEISNCEIYTVEININSNKAIFAIRDIYFDKSTYQSVSELDSYVSNQFQIILGKYRDFMWSNCFSSEYDTHENTRSGQSKRSNKNNNYKSSHDNSPPPDMLAFYRNLLGLRLRFTHNELKAAYREAATKYHPDRYNTGDSRNKENAETLMKQVNEAHEILKKFAV